MTVRGGGSSSPGEDGSHLARGGSAPLRGREDTEELMEDSDEWLTGMTDG